MGLFCSTVAQPSLCLAVSCYPRLVFLYLNLCVSCVHGPVLFHVMDVSLFLLPVLDSLKKHFCMWILFSHIICDKHIATANIESILGTKFDIFSVQLNRLNVQNLISNNTLLQLENRPLITNYYSNVHM